jgi:hypothetical protein
VIAVRPGHRFSARRAGAVARRVVIVRVHAGPAPWVTVRETSQAGRPHGGARGSPFTVYLTWRPKEGRWTMPDGYSPL